MEGGKGPLGHGNRRHSLVQLQIVTEPGRQGVVVSGHRAETQFGPLLQLPEVCSTLGARAMPFRPGRPCYVAVKAWKGVGSGKAGTWSRGRGRLEALHALMDGCDFS